MHSYDSFAEEELHPENSTFPKSLDSYGGWSGICI